MRQVILISGSPGTGKTTIANKLSKLLPAELIDINKEAIENQFLKKDPNRDTNITDIKKLKKHLIKKIENSNALYVIIEGHYADIIPNKYVSKAIILRTHPEILKKRLEQRKYSVKKISENLQAEILGDCTYHAIESYGTDKVYELDNSELSIEQTIEILISLIKANKIEFFENKIDWLGTLEKNGKLSEYFD